MAERKRWKPTVFALHNCNSHPRGDCKANSRMSRTKGRRRDEILDHARKLLIEGGPNAVVFRTIAAQIGTTHGNLQHYFPSRMDLIVAVCDREVASYSKVLREVGSGSLNRRQRISQIIESCFALSRSPDALIWRLIIGMADHAEEIAALHLREVKAYAAAIDKELHLAVPELSSSKRRHIVQVIQTVLEGLSIYYLHEKPKTPRSLALEGRFRTMILDAISVD